MNVVDFGILVIIGFYTVTGLQRGFLLGLIDLATFGMALVVGARLTEILATPLRDRGFPAPFAAGTAFAVAAVASFTVIGLAVRILLRPLGSLGTGTPLGWANSILGLLPGAMRGVAIAAIVMIVISAFPPELGLRPPLEASRLTEPLTHYGRQALDAGLRWAGLDTRSLGVPESWISP